METSVFRQEHQGDSMILHFIDLL